MPEYYLTKLRTNEAGQLDKRLLKVHIKAAGRPEAAKKLYEQLAKACDSLSQHPERESVPSELEGISEMLCRQIVIKNYRIIYQVIGKVVIIHGIIDGRRNLRETMRQRILI
jgi:toxin ParE1/3/4